MRSDINFSFLNNRQLIDPGVKQIDLPDIGGVIINEPDVDINLKLNQIINDISRGNITIEEAKIALEELGIVPTITTVEGKTVFEFEFNGKKYTINYSSNSSRPRKPPIIGKFPPPPPRPDIGIVFIEKPLVPIGPGAESDGEDDIKRTDKATADKEKLNDFESRINSSEFDIELTGKEVIEQIEEYAKILKAALKANYNYSDEYLDYVIQFAMDKLDISVESKTIVGGNLGSKVTPQTPLKYNLKDSLLEFKNLISTLTTNTDFQVIGSAKNTKGETVEANLLSGAIKAENMEKLIWQCYSVDNPQAQLFAHMFDKIIFNTSNLGLSEKERLSFFNILFKKLGGTVDDKGNYHISFEHIIQSLDSNNDGSWMDELFDIVNEEISKIRRIEKEEVNNAQTFELNSMFGDKEAMTAEEFMSNINEFRLSNDPGMRKLVQMLDKAFENYKCFSNEDKEQLIKYFITLINNECDIPNSNPPSLSHNAINLLNQDSIFEKIQSILTSETLYRAYNIDSDLTIDDFKQGNTGDCWLLSAIEALASSEAGRQLIKNQIIWADDYSSVKVYFAGVDKYITVTADEILKAKEGKLSKGDSDVLILELAMQKLYGDINGDESIVFWKRFIGNADFYGDMGLGIDDGWSYIFGGRQDMSSGDVRKFLQKLYKKQTQGVGVAATFSLWSNGGDTWNFTTIDGKSHSVTIKKGHVLAITNVTATTVTFVNPWNTSIEYTVTWDEFASMGISGVASAYFDKPKAPEENEFVINGSVYNIEEILNSDEPTYISLTSNTRGYTNSATDAKERIKMLLDSVVEHLVGYDKGKVELAYQTILNYYTAAIEAVTIRDSNGLVGNNFSYYDAVHDTWTTCDDKSDMRSAWDNSDVNSARDVVKKSNKGNTGLFIGHDKEHGGGHGNDKFFIYLDIQKLLEEFMALLG